MVTMPALAEKSPPGGGYTLVEMVVVLAVMALAAAVIAPGLFRTETSYLSWNGYRVISHLDLVIFSRCLLGLLGLHCPVLYFRATSRK